MGKLIAPNGLEIEGVLERCLCRADVEEFGVDETGTLVWEYAGSSKMFWDDQVPVEVEGQVVLIDSDGGEWKANECKFVDDNGTEVQVNG
jgi:hypothetical protein